jgi:hypothetical protein
MAWSGTSTSRKIGIDRNEIIFASELHTEAGEINNRDRIRPGRRDLTEKFAKRFS